MNVNYYLSSVSVQEKKKKGKYVGLSEFKVCLS